MIGIIFISKEEDAFASLKSGLKRTDEVEWHQVDTSGKALEMISAEAIDLVVTDENIADMTGLEFAEKLVSVNPMVNCAVASSLSPEAFHRASEGLGILAQLPIRPDDKQATILLERLKEVLSLTKKK